MAAGLGSKTFTTGEVLSAGDVNGYLMQGVLVFASAAARDAAITSPQEGQYAYLKDTDATVYYSGSAWVAAGSSGSMTSIASGSFPTASATLSLTSISGSYTHLQLHLIAWNGSGNNTFTARLNGDTGANYGYTNEGYTQSTIRTQGLVGQTSFAVSIDAAVSGNNKNITVMNFPFYTNATTGKIVESSTGFLDSTSVRAMSFLNGYYYGTNAAITQIDLIYGSNWAGGTYVLYGVK
jgi:hypothetical protein